MKLLSKAAALGTAVLAAVTVYEKLENTKTVQKLKAKLKR